MVSPAGSGTPRAPYYHYPGSGGNAASFTTTYLPQVLRPAETAAIADGMAWSKGNTVRTTFGCEAAEMHQGGGNHLFLDGHACWIVGNSERHLKQRADGKWFEQYFTYSME